MLTKQEFEHRTKTDPDFGDCYTDYNHYTRVQYALENRGLQIDHDNLYYGKS